MNTIEILQEQRKAVERRLKSLKDERDLIQVAIRAVESRKGASPNGKSAKNDTAFCAEQPQQQSKSQRTLFLVPGIRH